jgi:hypothetical protein
LGGFEQIPGMMIRHHVKGGGFLYGADDPDGISASGIPAAGNVRCPVPHHHRGGRIDPVLPAGLLYHTRFGFAALALVRFRVGAEVNPVNAAAGTGDLDAHFAVNAL